MVQEVKKETNDPSQTQIVSHIFRFIEFKN